MLAAYIEGGRYLSLRREYEMVAGGYDTLCPNVAMSIYCSGGSRLYPYSSVANYAGVAAD